MSTTTRATTIDLVEAGEIIFDYMELWGYTCSHHRGKDPITWHQDEFSFRAHEKCVGFRVIYRRVAVLHQEVVHAFVG